MKDFFPNNLVTCIARYGNRVVDISRLTFQLNSFDMLFDYHVWMQLKRNNLNLVTSSVAGRVIFKSRLSVTPTHTG